MLLQETMGDEALVVSWLKVGFKNWDFVGLDANGRSGGVALGWNTMRIKFSTTWGFDSGLGALVQEVGSDKEYEILNVYGPYQDRSPFWEALARKSFFSHSNLILGET
jgi:hypothetical protein